MRHIFHFAVKHFSRKFQTTKRFQCSNKKAQTKYAATKCCFFFFFSLLSLLNSQHLPIEFTQDEKKRALQENLSVFADISCRCLWRKSTTKALTVGKNRLNNIFSVSFIIRPVIHSALLILFFKGESKNPHNFKFGFVFDNEKTLKKFHDILQHTLNNASSHHCRLCKKIVIRLQFSMFLQHEAEIEVNCRQTHHK